ncbi:MAG: sensor domain-containing protein [Anaerolineae bacterium]|nr:sensor domain-containing protein [Anaerolineae bacterium]
MNTSNFTIDRFFSVVGSGQAYLNLLYVLFAFPLGIFYFVFLVTGISAGVPLLIIWVGIPVLLLVGGGWWLLAAFEREMAIHWLKEEIPPMMQPSNPEGDLWSRFRTHLANPVTWKSLLYLLSKFPLGIIGFVVTVTIVSLSLSFLLMPLAYPFIDTFGPSVSFGPGIPIWQIDSLQDALLACLVGMLLWPVALHITNGLAWVNAQWAKIMLGNPQINEVDKTKLEETE